MRELRREQLTAAQAEAMKHILPFKEKQIRQRELEAEAEKAARIGNAQAAGQRAVEHLAGVDKRRLVVGDILSWNEAAIRVGASRWAILPQDAAPPAEERLGIRLSTGEPGQTCIEIVAGEAQAPEKPASSESRGPAFSRGSYGQVWPASLTVSPDGRMMALAVQPLENWRKMWVFRLGKEGWQADALPPSLDEPELDTSNSPAGFPVTRSSSSHARSSRKAAARRASNCGTAPR